MSTFDIIPDIHGQSDKLNSALSNLGWRRRGLGWTHPEADRQIVFLGDFIDRGPGNKAVIKTVRELIDAGRARAIMGNHELNALHFHMKDPETGEPLRAHTPKNVKQHRTFLDQFPLGDPETQSVLDWMRTLPLFLEEKDFRAVHACWSEISLDRLKALTGDGVLGHAELIQAAGSQADVEIFLLAEQITKGPEHLLPRGWSFKDKDGNSRKHVRLQWWRSDARTWRDIAISVPSTIDLPAEDLPKDLVAQTYPPTANPVFFGHYWLTGKPSLQASNALCLDYSAGKDGPLVTYEFTDPIEPISLDRMRIHSATS